MKTALFMLKRTLRRWPVFLLLLLAPVFAVQLSGAQETPPAGLYMPENDPVSARVAEHLLDNGFVLCDDPETMGERVRIGELDCGAVFPEGFADRVADGELEGCIRFYVSPTSYTPELYKSHVTAAVYREYAPYISAEAFSGTEVSEADVVAEYEAMFAGGHAFSFDVIVGDGMADPENIKARSLAMGAAAILMCTVVFAFCAEILEKSFRPMLGRLGLGRCVYSVLLPETLLNALWAALFGGAGLYLAGFPELVLPVFIYAALLTGVGTLFASLFKSAKLVYILLPIIVICSAALCPVYTDLALLVPAVENVRSLLPAYWLWLIPEDAWLWVLIAAAAFALGIFSVTITTRYIKRMK